MDCVCFLPGILGSELRNDKDQCVWPPDWNEAVTELADWKLERLLDVEPLHATAVIERVCVKNIYGGLLGAIEEIGYSRFGRQKRMVPLPYDWRLDIVTEIAPDVAKALDGLVEQGGTQFRFVAHSMGGLVARVLLQHPDYHNRLWRKNATQLVTIATPFKGAPLAVGRLMGIEGTSGIPARAFAKLRVKALHGPFQLMPPAGQPIVWTVSGQRLDSDDLYAAGGFGDANGFLRSALESVGRMHAVLDEPWPKHIAAFQFAGSGLATVTRLAEHKGLRQVTDDDAGDKTVPLSSATGTTAPTMILPGEHLDLVNNRKLRRTLRALLGADDNLVIFAAGTEGEALEEQAVQLSVPVLGVVPKPNGRVCAELLVTLSRRLEVNTHLRIEITGLNGRTEEPDAGLPTVHFDALLNRGTLEQVIKFDADLVPGLYRIAAKMPGDEQGETTLIVRRTET